MDTYDIWLLVIGLAGFGAAWMPHLLHQKPISFPMLYLAIGAVLFAVSARLETPDVLYYRTAVERLTELIVIIALMGVGLKLERPVGWASWGATWRLLSVTMLLCIAGYALLGWWALSLSPAAAVLLGAALAPTDPVLAADVQSPAPLEGEDDEVRFALTSEAGLNDGLAFPFTNLAILMAVAGLRPEKWLVDWLLVDVLYKIGVGLVMGVLAGRLVAFIVFRLSAKSERPYTEEGIVALALTLVTYALTEFIHGYGFIAVFVAALTLRQYERRHEYHRVLHKFTDDIERVLMAVLLILLGGILAGDVLRNLSWEIVAVGIVGVFVLRPLAGMAGLAGLKLHFREKAAISFFGIRGMGSIYYLGYGLRQTNFDKAEVLWTVVGFIVLLSVVVHGITATPVMRFLDTGRFQRDDGGMQEGEAEAQHT